MEEPSASPVVMRERETEREGGMAGPCLLAEALTETPQLKRILGSDGDVSFTAAPHSSPAPGLCSESLEQAGPRHPSPSTCTEPPSGAEEAGQAGLPELGVTSPFCFQPVLSSPW